MMIDVWMTLKTTGNAVREGDVIAVIVVAAVADGKSFAVPLKMLIDCDTACERKDLLQCQKQQQQQRKQ